MPAATLHVLASGPLGYNRFGDGKNTPARLYSKALQMNCTFDISKYAKALTVTYTVQKTYSAPLLLYYLVVSPSGFAINGDTSIIAPDQIVYVPRQVTGRTLLGQPILQGYATMTWTWSVLQWAEYQQIISYYSPTSPTVLLTYPDQVGTWQHRTVALHPPIYGTMGVGHTIQDLQITFYKLS